MTRFVILSLPKDLCVGATNGRPLKNIMVSKFSLSKAIENLYGKMPFL